MNCRYAKCGMEFDTGEGVPGGFCSNEHKWLHAREGQLQAQQQQMQLQFVDHQQPAIPGIWGRSPRTWR